MSMRDLSVFTDCGIDGIDGSADGKRLHSIRTWRILDDKALTNNGQRLRSESHAFSSAECPRPADGGGPPSGRGGPDTQPLPATRGGCCS